MRLRAAAPSRGDGLQKARPGRTDQVRSGIELKDKLKHWRGLQAKNACGAPPVLVFARHRAGEATQRMRA